MEYFFIVFGYLIGAIPFGLLYGKMAGVDVRREGSGNIGATNVNRLLGRKLGVLTLVSDLLKGLLPMVIASFFLTGPDAPLWVIFTGLAAFIGHCWPVYLKFSGGKGVATALGVFIYLDPLSTLAAALVFVIVVRVSGFVSLGSMSAAVSLPIIMSLAGTDKERLLVAGLIATLIVFRHYENIDRLVKGTEKSWKTGRDGKEDQA